VLPSLHPPPHPLNPPPSSTSTPTQLRARPHPPTLPQASKLSGRVSNLTHHHRPPSPTSMALPPNCFHSPAPSHQVGSLSYVPLYSTPALGYPPRFHLSTPLPQLKVPLDFFSPPLSVLTPPVKHACGGPQGVSAHPASSTNLP